MQSDFRLLLGKQLIGGYTVCKYEIKVDPIFIGPNKPGPTMKIHEIPECLLLMVNFAECTKQILVRTNAQSTVVLSAM